MAIPAGTDKEKRNRVSAQKHQTQENAWLDQEDELKKWNRSGSTAHVEGTEITLTLKIPVGKPKKTLDLKKNLCAGLTGDTRCGFGLAFPYINNGQEIAFAVGKKKSLVVSPSYF